MTVPDIRLGWAEAEADIGLLVMATRPQSGLPETLSGSTFHAVLRASACPLLVVHPRGGGWLQ
jgi:nucleotide-binding universal stress UspA family protein